MRRAEYANIGSVQWRTEPPMRVGSVVGFVARLLGRRLDDDYEIVETTPVRIVMRTAPDPAHMETSYE